jgi:hypothetical protein
MFKSALILCGLAFLAGTRASRRQADWKKGTSPAIGEPLQLDANKG